MDSFIENSVACYKPGENLTIAEQLLPSKDRCLFTQYIPNEQDKFGLKICLLACVHMKYVPNEFFYTGQDTNRPTDKIVYEYVMMRFTEGYLGKRRNITTYNYFTSLKPCAKLKANSTSLVRTLKKDRKELPLTAKLGRQPLYFKTSFKKDNDITITYQEKKKHVPILSSLYPNITIDNNEKKRPDIVMFYKQSMEWTL